MFLEEHYYTRATFLSKEKRYRDKLTILLLTQVLIQVYISYLSLHITMANVFKGLEKWQDVRATVVVEWRVVHDWHEYLVEQKNQAWDVIRVYREEEIASIEAK